MMSFVLAYSLVAFQCLNVVRSFALGTDFHAPEGPLCLIVTEAPEMFIRSETEEKGGATGSFSAVNRNMKE